MGLFSKMFGGNKSEKDVRAILPLVTKINQHFDSFQSVSNDELRSKTLDFRRRIKDALKNIDAQIADTNKRADEISLNDLFALVLQIYQLVLKIHF